MNSSESDVDQVMASFDAQYEFHQTQIDARTVAQQNVQVIVNEDPSRVIQAADATAQGREERAAAAPAVAVVAVTVAAANNGQLKRTGSNSRSADSPPPAT